MILWKAVVGFEGYYEVSDQGEIRSIDRIDCAGARRKERVLKPGPSGFGYLSVDLSVNGKSKRVRIHKMVLEAFVGKCPPGMECCHGDSNRANNKLSNLRWDTKKSNAEDREKAGNTAKGSTHGQSVIDEAIAKKVKIMLADGKKPSYIAEELGIKRHIVANIKQNHSWRHV